MNLLIPLLFFFYIGFFGFDFKVVLILVLDLEAILLKSKKKEMFLGNMRFIDFGFVIILVYGSGDVIDEIPR